MNYLLFFTFFFIFSFFFFFFNDTATTEIYTLSLHDALPIPTWCSTTAPCRSGTSSPPTIRSEEHTSELQSRFDLVCRLLLEKKKKTKKQDDKKKKKKTTIKKKKKHSSK